MYALREALDTDFEFCKTIGHEGLKPYIEKLTGWDQDNEDRGFLNHWDPEQIKIIQCQGEDAGYIEIEDHIAYLRIDGIYIARNCRNRGLGTKVVKDMISSSTRPVRLQVYKISPALGLYRRLGFEINDECEIRYYMEYKPGDS